MPEEYDVFVSHAHRDGARPGEIADALRAADLRVWFDEKELKTFESISRAIEKGLANSKVLLAFYSRTYPTRRACQWELTAACIAAQKEGNSSRRVLVVNPEDSAAHIQPVELRDAQFCRGPTPGDASELEQLAQAVREQVGRTNGILGNIHPVQPPVWRGMHGVGSTRFVGRFEEIWKIHSLLHAGDAALITGTASASGRVARISGIGGQGKSLLAEEYGLRFGSAYPGGIFWLRAYGNDDAKAVLSSEEREAERLGQVRAFTEALGVNVQGLTPAQIEGALSREIERRDQPCLWVVDDVPSGLNAQTLRTWFSPHPLARTLITTRGREYESVVPGFDLEELPPEDAIQLLVSHKRPTNEAEHDEAGRLVEDLGYHALALDVMGAALESWGGVAPFQSFRTQLARTDEDALELSTEFADVLPNGHQPSIAATLLSSISNLEPEGQDFLRLASVLAIVPIPSSFVIAVFQKADGLSHGDPKWRQAQAFKQVTLASLAKAADDEGNVRAVHALVSRAMRFRDAEPERTKILRDAAIELLVLTIAAVVANPRLHDRIKLEINHARELVSTIKNVSEANLAARIARYDREEGAHASAQGLLTRETKFRRDFQGAEHPDTLISVNNLAVTLGERGDLAGARVLQEETLAIRRGRLGVEHADTLTSMCNLAETLRSQGDLAGARELMEDTLAGRRRVLGTEHPDTLASMNNLAATLHTQGELAAARTLQEEELTICRRVLGGEHPTTLTSMSNLAELLAAQGDLASAWRLQEETLSVRRQVLGVEHPDTLMTMSNLAESLRAQAHLAEARKLQEETFAVRHRTLGAEHPDTLTSRNNLAGILSAQGDLAGACELQEKTLEARLRVLGADHPDTLTSMSNLAESLHAQGDLAGARKLQERTFAIRRRVLGTEHPDTLTSMNNLAVTLHTQGDLAGARKLHEEALAVLHRDLGVEHPDTSISAWNLLPILFESGERDAAQALCKQYLTWLLDRDPKTLGSEQRKIREMLAQRHT
jgi:hypothetical protein